MSFKLTSSPWKILCEKTEIPEVWRNWLSNSGSMTRALEKASAHPMCVLVQNEGWKTPWPDELEMLGVDDDTYWIREVVLVTGEPVMFARSVFPRTLVEHFPKLISLGNQALGHTLFAGKNFIRDGIEIAEIKAGDLLWEQMPFALQLEHHWARRSLFQSRMSPLLLSEVFLPYVATL